MSSRAYLIEIITTVPAVQVRSHPGEGSGLQGVTHQYCAAVMGLSLEYRPVFKGNLITAVLCWSNEGR
ncbi:hypothetical protein [Metallosphaera yellowstonensis]|uniref:hypothetical protein n=1 Tax=Metallosphaera yellowstonensis TaxID=1111107 RepID=UPI0012DC5318|nr:hypothetical protein [Metallosphaera yellowstonensis]